MGEAQRIIEPGTESDADTLDAIRALALSALSAMADVADMGSSDPATHARIIAGSMARRALLMEIDAAERSGMLARVSQMLHRVEAIAQKYREFEAMFPGSADLGRGFVEGTIAGWARQPVSRFETEDDGA